MFIRELSARGLARQAFERLIYAATFGAVCGASVACSGFSPEDCTTSRTCPRAPGEGGSGSSDVDSGIPSSGGSGGSGGSFDPGGGAGGRTETGGSVSESAGGASSGGGEPIPDAGFPDASGDAKTPVPVDAGSDGTTDAEADAGPLVCTNVVADCNHDRRDGCETSLQNDPAHCGACDLSCNQNGASSVACLAGVCKPKCDAAHLDCNTKPGDACEIDRTSDSKNCGTCGDTCGTNKNTSSNVCLAGKCKATCDATHADCNAGTVAGDADGCETDLNSKTSCGLCGRNCQGGECINQTCRPFVVAQHINYGANLAVDSKYAYYADTNSADDQGELMRVPVTGGVAATTIAIGSAASIATDGTHLYFGRYSTSSPGNDGAVLRFINGTADVVPFQGLCDPTVVAVDSKNAYWYDDYAKSISYKPHAAPGILPVSLKDISGVTALASDGASLFGLSDGGHTLFAVPVPAGKPTISTSSINSDPLNVVGFSIAVDATAVYAWFTDASTNAHLWSLSKTNFAPIKEVASASIYTATVPFVVSGGFAYVANESGIHRVPVDGSRKMLDDMPVAQTSVIIRALTVAGGALYWIDSTTASDADLMKLAIF